ncbi:MAG TPA: PH domain-containing protein [Pyrinomonadaceae bacterium]|nr:PH domain-containing protein [Pyrinomonadaceae bacterium]
MYCMNCGADIPSNVRFCSSCGAPTDTEATRVASRGGDRPVSGGETAARVRTSFDQEMTAVRQPESPAPSFGRASQATPQTPMSPPKVTTQTTRADGDDTERVIFSVRPTFLFIGIGYFLAAVAAVGLSILLAMFAGQYISAPITLLLTLPLLLIPAYKHLKRNSIKYTLTDSKIEIDQGFISRKTRNIPLRNIQDVTVSTSIPQRIFGFGDLVIENANEVGGQTLLDNIPQPRRHAELLLRELRRWN